MEIGPQDADYARLAAQALTEDEVARRRAQWRDGDEALHVSSLSSPGRADYRWSDPTRCGPRQDHGVGTGLALRPAT